MYVYRLHIQLEMLHRLVQGNAKMYDLYRFGFPEHWFEHQPKTVLLADVLNYYHAIAHRERCVSSFTHLRNGKICDWYLSR